MGISPLPYLGDSSVDYKLPNVTDSKTKSNSTSINWNALEGLLIATQNRLDRKYVAIYSLRDSSGHGYNYYYRGLRFSPEAMEESTGEVRSFLYVVADDGNGIPRLALAYIPDGELAYQEMTDWIRPKISNEGSKQKMDCEFVEVPGTEGEVCVGDSTDCSYWPPLYDWECGLSEPTIYDWPEDPDNPGGGGGGGGDCPYGCTEETEDPCDQDPVPLSCQVEMNPCEQVAELEGDSEFISKLNNLKINASSLNKETAYVMGREPEGGYLYSYQQGEDGDRHMGISGTGKFDGYIHSHYDYPGVELIFSLDDLLAIAKLYDQESIVDIGTFTAGVVTHIGTAYILKIEDKAAFHQFAQNLLNDFSQLSQYHNNLKATYNGLYGHTSTSAELALAQTLQDKNSGIKLFKGNSSFNNWQAFENQNNQVTNVNCN